MDSAPSPRDDKSLTSPHSDRPDRFGFSGDRHGANAHPVESTKSAEAHPNARVAADAIGAKTKLHTEARSEWFKQSEVARQKPLEVGANHHYKVEQYDCLWTIAERRLRKDHEASDPRSVNREVERIRQLNATEHPNLASQGKDRDRIHEGQQLRIYEDGHRRSAPRVEAPIAEPRPHRRASVEPQPVPEREYPQPRQQAPIYPHPHARQYGAPEEQPRQGYRPPVERVAPPQHRYNELPQPRQAPQPEYRDVPQPRMVPVKPHYDQAPPPPRYENQPPQIRSVQPDYGAQSERPPYSEQPQQRYDQQQQPARPWYPWLAHGPESVAPPSAPPRNDAPRYQESQDQPDDAAPQPRYDRRYQQPPQQYGDAAPNSVPYSMAPQPAPYQRYGREPLYAPPPGVPYEGEPRNPIGEVIGGILSIPGQIFRSITDRSRFYNTQKNSWSCAPTALGMAIADHKLGRPITDGEVMHLSRESGSYGRGWEGGANNMARVARMNGVHAEAHVGHVSLSQLDTDLLAGKGAVVDIKNPTTGNGHYLYVAGMTKDGQHYIIGNPDRRGSERLGHNRPVSKQELASMLAGAPVPGYTAIW